MGGPRGRLISASDRETAVKLINEARTAGTRLKPACEVLGISNRTYQRWTRGGIINEDQRPVINRPSPENKLTEEERAKVIETANSTEFADLPPCQIVPKLADKGEYIASESTFYRILKDEKMDTYRNRSKQPVKREPPPTPHIATAPIKCGHGILPG